MFLKKQVFYFKRGKTMLKYKRYDGKIEISAVKLYNKYVNEKSNLKNHLNTIYCADEMLAKKQQNHYIQGRDFFISICEMLQSYEALQAEVESSIYVKENFEKGGDF